MSDLFTTEEKVNLLFKRALNKPSTSSSLEFFQEPALPARPMIFQEDILSSSIPSTAPSELIGLSDSSLDDNGNKLKGSYAGKTSNDGLIRFYCKIPLEAIAGTTGTAFQAQDATVSHPGGYADGTTATNYGTSYAYGRVIQNSIPFNYSSDGSYNVTVYKSTGTALPFGSTGGGWLVDPRAGVVSFYQIGNITGVSEASPILISFYRYVGELGSLASGEVNSSVTGTTNTFTAQQTFTGGTTQATGDLLSAIMVDNRNVGSLSDGELLDAIQFGGNYDSSWRVCVQATPPGSRFLLQARESGSWVTKAQYISP